MCNGHDKLKLIEHSYGSVTNGIAGIFAALISIFGLLGLLAAIFRQ